MARVLAVRPAGQQLDHADTALGVGLRIVDEAALEPGYYPALGWPAGTVVAWDGEVWREPVTAPGFYAGPGGVPTWWNGRAWIPDIVSPPAGERTPAERPRGARAHRRRRPTVWSATATVLLAGAAGLLAAAVAVRLA